MATQAKEVLLTPPLSIAGCATWLDAADITTMFQNTAATTPITADGQTIGAWKDKSPKSYVFTQSTTANQPTYKTSILNGTSITRWNGSSTGLLSTTAVPFYTSASSGGSFFVVFMTTNNSSQRFLMTHQNQVYGTFCQTETELGYTTGNTTQGNFGLHRGCSYATVAYGQIVTNQYYMMSYILGTSGTTPANSAIFKNGASVAIQNDQLGFYSGGSYPSGNTAGYLTIGYRVPNGAYSIDCWHSGDIAELIWFQTPLTTTQQQQVEGYLSWKWGLQTSFPGSHPYAYSYQYQSITRTVPFKATSSSYFLPTAISGCQLWMDAADSTTITRSGVNITGWNDKANLYTGTATNNPQYNSNPINGLPTIRFDGGSSRYVLLTANNFNYSTMTYCLVIRWISGSGGFMGTDTPGNYGRALAISSPNVQLLLYSQFYTTTVPLSAGQPCILFAYFNGTTDFTVILNGTKTLFSVAQGSGNTNTNGFNIGVFNPSNGGSHSFDMGEGIVYNSILSDAQRQQVEGYLAWKWGLQSSLVTTHPNSTTAYVPFPFPTTIPKASVNQWLPSRISGNQLWMDATDSSKITFSSGNAIATWIDKSPNGYTGSASNSPTLVYNSQNGLPCISFTAASSQYINFGNILPQSAFSVFVVMKSTFVPGTTQAFIGKSSYSGENSRWTFIYESSNLYTIIQNGGGPSATAAPYSGVFSFFNYVIGDIEQSLYANGTTLSTSGPWTYGYTTNTNYILVGAYQNPSGTVPPQGFYYNGIMGEIIYYNTGITQKQRQQVEGYLAWKWGLMTSLPAGHPYINFPPSP